MNIDVWHALEGIAAFIFSSLFLGGLVKLSFAAGDLVRGQKELTIQVSVLTTQVKDAGTNFERFATTITAAVQENRNHVSELKTEMGIMREVYPIGGRRSTDQPHSDR